MQQKTTVFLLRGRESSVNGRPNSTVIIAFSNVPWIGPVLCFQSNKCRNLPNMCRYLIFLLKLLNKMSSRCCVIIDPKGIGNNQRSYVGQHQEQWRPDHCHKEENQTNHPNGRLCDEWRGGVGIIMQGSFIHNSIDMFTLWFLCRRYRCRLLHKLLCCHHAFRRLMLRFRCNY
jgi:hypothetical protein